MAECGDMAGLDWMHDGIAMADPAPVRWMDDMFRLAETLAQKKPD